MVDTAARIQAEIEADRREVRWSAILTLITLVGLGVGVYCDLSGLPNLYTTVAFLLAYLAGGVPATLEALNTLRQGRLDINLLMILAALAAAGVGEPRDGAILLFLFSLAGTLEGYAMGNTKRAVAALMKLRPDEANRVNADGSTTRVKVEELAIGERVVVRPGERLPVDGTVVAGAGAIDQAPVTGESVPIDKSVGDEVFAGTVNQNAVLTLLVTKSASHSTLARMIELVTEAQEKRSPSEQFSDWFGERYTVLVLLGSITALGVFLWLGMETTLAFYKAATLLVVASPCAIVISVPAAVLSALAASAQSGVLFKGGSALESFGNVKTIAFDKTGTLTEGRVAVTNIVPFGALTADSLLELAAALETHSEHPLAVGVRNHAAEKEIALLEAQNVLAVPGKGIIAVIDGATYWAGNRTLMTERALKLLEKDETTLIELEAAGKTIILVGDNTEVLGAIALADQVRVSALSALARLKQQGINRLVMLSGDTKTVATAVGRVLSFSADNIHGSLLPEDKVRVVDSLRQAGGVAFVGDGINDAAALATAHVGVAVGVGGSDVALEAADVALLSEDLTRLAVAHSLAKRTNRIIKQNLYFAVGIMALMVVTATFWYLPLPLGVIGHEGGTLLVVANGLRLLFTKVV